MATQRATLKLVADVAAPDAPGVSTTGIASDAFVIPAGVHRMWLEIQTPQLHIHPTTANANLVCGPLDVIDTTIGQNIICEDDGGYPVTPGHAITIAIEIDNVFSESVDPAAAPVGDWRIPYARVF